MLLLPVLLAQIESVAEQPVPIEFSRACLNDFVMSCGYLPMPKERWEEMFREAAVNKKEAALLEERGYAPPFASKQAGLFAIWGVGTDLFKQTRASVQPAASETPSTDSFVVFLTLFSRLRGVPPEIISNVRFRQEEALRAWAMAFGVGIAGEEAKESLAKLRRLDYFGVMSDALEAEEEFAKKRAEKMRKLELKRIAEEKKRAESEAASGSYE